MNGHHPRGYLNATLIRALTFWTTTVCLVVAAASAILAIWQFTGTDALWRTVATCAVIGSAALTFSWVNGLFADDQ